MHAQNWVQPPGVPTGPIICVTEHQGNIYALSLDSVYRSRDGGATWLPTTGQPGKAGNLTVLHPHAEYLYLGTIDDGVFRSNNGGDQWERFNAGNPGTAITQFLSLGDSLYAGTDGYGVFVRALPASDSWFPYNDGLERSGVTTMATSNDLLLATIGFSVYVRMRASSAWTEVLLDSVFGQLPVNEFYRFGNYLFAGVGIGVYRGAPDATAWQKVGIHLLPNRPVEHFAAHGRRLFAGVRYKLEHFICYSDDAGDNWGVKAHEFSVLLDMKVVGDRIFTGREDGLWYLDLEAPTNVTPLVDVKPGSFRLEQNYPNPFNPRTGVRFQVAGVSQVELVVHDLLGREVATLVNEMKPPGYYEVAFDGSGLASGIYICRLRAGTFIESRTMLLLK